MVAENVNSTRYQGPEAKSVFNAAQKPPSDPLRLEEILSSGNPKFCTSRIDATAGHRYDLSAMVNVPFPRIDPGTEQRTWSARRDLKTIGFDVDLDLVKARCLLKAEGLRWAVERRGLITGDCCFKTQIVRRDRDLIERASEVSGCYLWMNRPEAPVPHTPSQFEDVACWYELLAAAASFVDEVLDKPEDHEKVLFQALGILAEVQSALRVAIGWIGGPDDPDQLNVFAWLRTVAQRKRMYLRHLGSDVTASPPNRAEVASRLDVLISEFRYVHASAKRRKSWLNRCRYHAKLISEGTGTEHDWRKIAEAIADLINDGLPSSSVEIRDILLPIIGEMPELDGLPQGYVLALRGIEDYHASRWTHPASTCVSVYSPGVAEVAGLLKGRSVVLIGGKRRPEVQQSLHTAFRLEEMVWIETREHQSIKSFEAVVARPDIALVLLAIRWSSHSFGEVKRFCETYDKAFVRLPGGYNPNQVAAQILSQCSDQLAHASQASIGCNVTSTLDA